MGAKVLAGSQDQGKAEKTNFSKTKRRVLAGTVYLQHRPLAKIMQPVTDKGPHGQPTTAEPRQRAEYLLAARTG